MSSRKIEFKDRIANVEDIDNMYIGNELFYNRLEYIATTIVKNKNGEIISVQNLTSKPDTYKIIYNKLTTVVILDDGSKGVAKCNPMDIYNGQTGFDIAYKRAKIKQLKKEIRELSSY